MSKTWLAITLPLMTLAALLGFLLVEWYGRAILDGSFIQWQAVGVVPEDPLQIIGIIDDGLFPLLIEGDSGQIYRCCDDFNQPTWQVVAPPAQVPTPVANTCAGRTRFPKPGVTVDCKALLESEFTLGSIEYVLYADGSVWRWHQKVGLGTSILIELRICAGLAAVLASLVVLFVAKILKSRGSGKMLAARPE